MGREHGLQETRRFLLLIDQQLVQGDHTAGRVTSADHVFLPQCIGFTLVVARIARQQCAGAQLAADRDQPAPLAVRRGNAGTGYRDLGNHRLPLTLCGMARIDVAHFVAEQGRQFGFVLQIDHDAARDPHRPAREGIGVDVIGVEHAIRVRHLRPVRQLVEPLADRADITVDPRILHRSEILRELLRRDLLVDALLLRLAHADQNGLAADRRLCATGHRRRAEQPEHLAAGYAVALKIAGQFIVIGHGSLLGSILDELNCPAKTATIA